MLTKKEQRLRRARQTRIRIATQGVPRLTVNRTNLHIYASLISGDGAKVLASAPATDARAAATPTKAAGNEDPFDYFVQAGAFRTQQDADAQRAKLAMLGWEARVSEREQNGRNVFRVRVGPFAKRDDADQLKEKLAGAGVEAALVRVQR